jgi:hypothetical protein
MKRSKSKNTIESGVFARLIAAQNQIPYDVFLKNTLR